MVGVRRYVSLKEVEERRIEVNRLGRRRRMEYRIMVGLYQHGYTTVEIAELFHTPNGHVSKVLRGEGVKMRRRGQRGNKIPFDYFDEELQMLLLSDADIYHRFARLFGGGSMGDEFTVGDLIDDGYLEDLDVQDDELMYV